MTVREARAAYRRQRPRHVVLPGVLDAAEARALRARIAPSFAPYHIPDRGRFALSHTAPAAALFARLQARAAATVGRALRVGPHLWTRLGRGDYALVLADATLRPPGPHVEVLLDLSPRETGEADVVYLERGALAVVPQQPGSATIVGRGPSTWRFDRYLTARVGTAEVWRLRLALLPITPRAGSAGRPTGAGGRGSRSGAHGGR